MKLSSKLVLIRCDTPKEKDENGIFVQEEWITTPPTGTVEGIAYDVGFCKVGDRVWFERYTSVPHPEDKGLRVCREEAVLAVLDEG